MSGASWWYCRWCGNPWRPSPAVVRQPVGRSLAMYRDHLRACIPFRSRIRAVIEAD